MIVSLSKSSMTSLSAAISLACVWGVLLAPVVCQSRLAKEFGESLAEMSGLAAFEPEQAGECDACLANHEQSQPTPVDYLAWGLDLLCIADPHELGRCIAELGVIRIPWPHATASARQSSLQVYRC